MARSFQLMIGTLFIRMSLVISKKKKKEKKSNELEQKEKFKG